MQSDSKDSKSLSLQTVDKQVVMGPVHLLQPMSGHSATLEKATMGSLNVTGETKLSGFTTLAGTKHTGQASFPGGLKSAAFQVDGADGEVKCGTRVKMFPKSGVVQCEELHAHVLIVDKQNVAEQIHNLSQEFAQQIHTLSYQVEQLTSKLETTRSMLEQMEHDLYGAEDILEEEVYDELS